MSRRRAGIAIVAALGGIVVIGALIAGVFFVSTQESQISGGTLVHERAFRAAELGLNTTLAKWDKAAMFALPTGGMDTLAYSGVGWVDTVVITKLTPRSFVLRSTGTAGSGRLARSRKRTQLNVRLAVPTFNFLGALTARGATTIGGSSDITGYDTNPTAWSCPLTTDALAGVVTPDLSTIKWIGDNCSDAACVDGEPAVLQDTTAADTTNYFKFGDEDWASLTAGADKIIPGGTTLAKVEPAVTGGVCDTNVLENWGEPTHTNTATLACKDYFPVIHAKGNLNITAHRGQGILLVDGDLSLSGGFEFYGPIIVRGKLSITGTGAKLNGSVMAANVDLDETKITGNATLKYSSCAVEKAIGGSSFPQRVEQRAWTELH